MTALLVLALASLALAPTASGKLVVIGTFQGDISNSTLEFNETLLNSSLVLEIPRGADVTTASLTVEGVPTTHATYRDFDFNTTKVGTTLWALYMDGLRVYPPRFDPYTTFWAPAWGRTINDLKRSDDSYWYIATPGESIPPPLEWPVQLFHFRPVVTAEDNLTVRWEGYSQCTGNLTNEYHAEMWMYNHSSSLWEKVREYSSKKGGDVNLTYQIDRDRSYINANGSIPVAIVGIHAEGHVNPPVVISDYGNLYTDYMGLAIETSKMNFHPTDATFTLGGTEVYNSSGPLIGSVEIGDAQGLRDTLQSIIDGHEVRPGNVTIPFEFRLGALGGMLDVGDLHVEYQPVVNQAPVWNGTTDVHIDEDSPWTSVLDLGLAFTDDHNQGALLFQVVTNSEAGNVSTRVRVNETDATVLEVLPAPDYFGVADLVVRATDLFGEGTDSPTVAVTIEPLGDPPSIVDPGQLDVREGEPISMAFELDDPDVPDDSFTWSDTSDWVDVDPADGTLEWTPGPDQVGTHEFTVTVTDGYGLNDTILVRIVVENVNNPPTIVSELVIDAVQDMPVSYTIVGDDPDLPHGDSLTYFAVSEDVLVDYDRDTGVIGFTPTNEHVPELLVSIGVRDSLARVHEAVLVVNVENVNDPPTIAPLHPPDVLVGELASHQLLLDDPDLHVELPVPEALTVTHDGIEALSPGEGWVISFTAVKEMVGEHTVTYTVTDGGSLTDSIEVVWRIIATNDPPVMTSAKPPTVEATEDSELALDLDALDPDGDDLTWSDDTDLFDIDPVEGTISFTPLQEHVGSHAVTVTVSDGAGGTATWAFQLEVANSNDAPVITSIGPAEGSKYGEGDAIPFAATATDEDGDDLTYTWYRGSKELGTGSELTYDGLSPGQHTIRLEVSDGTTSTEQTIGVTVEAEEGRNNWIVFVILVIVIATVGIAIAMKNGWL